MRSFTVADISPQCDVRDTAHYTYALLEKIPGTVEIIAGFSSELWKSPTEFVTPLPLTAGRLTLRWLASAETAGIATLWESDRIASISLLASGIDPDADTVTLRAFQGHIVKELHDTGFEPSFDLNSVRQRPLIATMGLFVPQRDPDRLIFAIADRCFAAAYFRKLGVA